ncbi:MAG: hypothetical protein JWQ54_1517 [Mucilaginibacter sp.]|nr:hypothetical protein [Mucilaginibacter sp.]
MKNTATVDETVFFNNSTLILLAIQSKLVY